MSQSSAPGTPRPAFSPRIDPAHDRRRLILYFGGLIAFYVGVILIARPDWGGGEDELQKIAFGLMLAPTVGAVLAAVFGPGVIRFGLPNWWLLASFVPALAIAFVTLVASATGAVELNAGKLALSLALVPARSDVVLSHPGGEGPNAPGPPTAQEDGTAGSGLPSASATRTG
jgi:hypothetical protein